MTLRVGICDDEVQDREVLQQHMEHYKMESDVDFEVDCFAQGGELLQRHLQKAYQVILLDIEMPGQSGMEIARYLREEEMDDVFIVFVTSYPEYMKDSFEVQPFQFLTKPVEYQGMKKLFQDILHRYQRSRTTKIVIGIDKEEYLVRIRDIVYMQAVKEKKPVLKYVLQDREIVGQGTIQTWEESLKEYGFISPCRGYLVNVKYIVSIDQTRIQLINDKEVPVSRRRAKMVQEMYAGRVIQTMN